VRADTIVIRLFDNEIEARLAASVLEANGVAALVVADTAGGALPSMALFSPVRLVVRADDADLALQLLDTAAEAPDEDDAPAGGE
jgi:hypothetical protein